MSKNNDAKDAGVKMTVKQMKEFVETYMYMLEKDPTVEDTKFGYAYKMFYKKNISTVFDEYNLLLGSVRIENALEDEKTKAVLTSEKGRGFQYSKDGLKAVIKAETALNKEWDIKEYPVEPYICKDAPKMSVAEEEVFKGLIIN